MTIFSIHLFLARLTLTPQTVLISKPFVWYSHRRSKSRSPRADSTSTASLNWDWTTPLNSFFPLAEITTIFPPNDSIRKQTIYRQNGPVTFPFRSPGPNAVSKGLNGAGLFCTLLKWSSNFLEQWCMREKISITIIRAQEDEVWVSFKNVSLLRLSGKLPEHPFPYIFFSMHGRLYLLFFLLADPIPTKLT